jgi:hypothetical protein
MAFREVAVVEVREVLRAWLSGTARRYVEAAQAAGLARDGGEDHLTDELVGQVVEAVRPVRQGGHGTAWQTLETEHDQISGWVTDGLTVVKIGTKLERRGVVVPYRTLHRYCVERCDFGRGSTTASRWSGLAADVQDDRRC